MPTKFTILDYARSVMIQGLSEADVCAIAKSLMLYQPISFDIVRPNTQGFEKVTADFAEMSDKSWKYDPQPREERSR